MLEELKELLGLEKGETDLDGKLNLLLKHARQRLKMKLGGIEPPTELEYIIIEVAVRRFNRIGSEGLASHSVEGESLSFSDNDFDGFSDEILAFLDSQKDSTRGKVRFL